MPPNQKQVAMKSLSFKVIFQHLLPYENLPRVKFNEEEYVIEAAREFYALSDKINFFISDNISTCIKISPASNKDIEKFYYLENEKSFRPHILLKLHGKIEYPKKMYSDIANKRIPLDFIQRQIFSEKINENFFNLYMACNIAKPGSVEIGTRIIYIGMRHYIYTDGWYSAFLEHYDESLSRGWPIIDQLNMLDTFNWVLRLNNLNKSNGIFQLYKAIGHLVGREGSPISYLITMIGLESFYKSFGSRRDLKCRINIVLGTCAEYDTYFNKMYNARSKLVHGGVELPTKVDYSHGDLNPAYERVIQDIEQLSASISISTLQTMAKNNAIDVDFTSTCYLHK